ncbi:MAG: 1-acyl-sn-glycerol-3-phosphate acyltransferase [Bryobacterales bacterium]|jgi:1-acyl-sn-glycerol-3-phosphate acyltransferase|nr:1-acyl-sn-glycerol-3-phosphate acyltransferase [Bryobacterales bacterium]
MASVVRSVWVWGATAFLAVFEYLVMAGILLVDRDPLRRRAGRFLHWCGRTVTRLLPAWQVRLEGQIPDAHEGPFLIVGNHQSHTDIPVICWLPLQFKWVAKKELFSIPVAGWMFGMAGQIAVDRKDSRAGAKALIQAARFLEQRMSVLFFPEGTRSRDGNLLRFQDGPFRLALKTGVPILPVVIEGTGDLLQRNSLLFTDAHLFRVRVLAPVGASKQEWTDASALRDAVHARMQAELDAMRGRDATTQSVEAEVDALAP